MTNGYSMYILPSVVNTEYHLTIWKYNKNEEPLSSPSQLGNTAVARKVWQLWGYVCLLFQPLYFPSFWFFSLIFLSLLCTWFCVFRGGERALCSGWLECQDLWQKEDKILSIHISLPDNMIFTEWVSLGYVSLRHLLLLFSQVWRGDCMLKLHCKLNFKVFFIWKYLLWKPYAWGRKPDTTYMRNINNPETVSKSVYVL